MKQLFLIKSNQELSSEFDKLEFFKNTPIYKLFNTIYDIESASFSRNHYTYFDVNLNKNEQFCEVRHNFKNPSIIISYYFGPKKALSIYDELIDINNDWEKSLFEKELLPIGISPNNQYLLLGVGNHNADKIFYETRWLDSIELLANNIFEYFFNIEIIPAPNNLLPELNILYKNWSEDFWRMRENDESDSILERKNNEIIELEKQKDVYYYRLKSLARNEKNDGLALSEISKKYGFSVEELEKSFF